MKDEKKRKRKVKSNILLANGFAITLESVCIEMSMFSDSLVIKSRNLYSSKLTQPPSPGNRKTGEKNVISVFFCLKIDKKKC